MSFDRERFESEHEIAKWRKQYSGMSMLQLCETQGRLWMAVLTTALIWPEFHRFEDAVFLREKFDPRAVSEWRGSLGADTSELERLLNHVHLWDIFAHDAGVSDESLEQLANLLVESWQAKLRQEFPDDRFSVQATQDVDGDYGPTVTFWKNR